MREHILNEMKVLDSIEPKFEIERRVSFIKKILQQANCKSLILGISGGVDSTVTGKLCQIAVEQLNLELNVNGYQFICCSFALSSSER